MSKTYIIGHKKPDTDSVVAAMALKYLYDSCECFGVPNSEAVISSPLNPETTFLFEKVGVKAPREISATDLKPEDKVILVDHNEESQRLDNLNSEQISEIVDHHKVNLNLNKPIFMTFKTWGSSCSVVYFLMKQNEIKPDKILASLMLAAILSDTVGYKSATTTDKDKELGTELAKIAEIENQDAFALEIFKAKSDVSALSDQEIVKNDYKIFEFGKKTMIDQLETVEQTEILTNKKDALLKAMAEVKATEGVELLYVAITDVLKVNTKLLILGKEEAEIAEKAFGGKVQDSVLDIGPKMSRKKEIAPAIEKALS